MKTKRIKRSRRWQGPDKAKECRVCGCTEGHACVTVGGICGWCAHDPNLCTACAEQEERQLGLTFRDLAFFNDARNVTRFAHCGGWSALEWAGAMCGEAGEAANLAKKMRRGQAVPPQMIGAELADVVIYADLLAQKLGLSLAQCVQEKFNAVSKRVDSPFRL